MIDDICLELVKSVVDSQKELVVVFKENEPVLTNRAFNSFVGADSFETYKKNFGPFVENFVPHPSYFNKGKMIENELWFETIMHLDEIDRVVSMMNHTYDPHAFSVNAIKSEDEYTIVTFEDITQTLIKRIMIQNHANIDIKSGAYAKDYFLQIMKNYEEAAEFNEKLIAVSMISLTHNDGINAELLQEFVLNFQSSTRQDDMLVHWSDELFFLVYLVDSKESAAQVTNKLKNITSTGCKSGLKCKLVSTLQEESEGLHKIVKYLLNKDENI